MRRRPHQPRVRRETAVTQLAGGQPLVLAGVGAAATATYAAYLILDDRPPGGRQRWTRTNHRGEAVTLLAGPAVAMGSTLGLLLAPGLGGRLRAAAVVATVGAGVVGGYDDLAGSGTARGFQGHLTALAKGQLTSGAIKIVGIGACGLVAAALVHRRPIDVAVGGAVVAGTANLLNLLDLRPGRALKASMLIAGGQLAAGATAAPVAAVALGSGAAMLAEDLGERSMLGDAGANALGALLGLVATCGASRRRLVLMLAVLVGLTVASERVSFTRVIEATPLLRELDRLGRRRGSASRTPSPVVSGP
jgi:UDP-GlcNAc:undecaprenyl-phosphate/decaprenyl-phosphate GlcNAc-1-phosphate transferase